MLGGEGGFAVLGDIQQWLVTTIHLVSGTSPNKFMLSDHFQKEVYKAETDPLLWSA